MKHESKTYQLELTPQEKINVAKIQANARARREKADKIPTVEVLNTQGEPVRVTLAPTIIRGSAPRAQSNGGAAQGMGLKKGSVKMFAMGLGAVALIFYFLRNK